MVGYDDSYLASASEFKLTTIPHPKTVMGRDAAKFSVDVIEGKRDLNDAKPTVYTPELKIRNSTQKNNQNIVKNV